MKVKSFKVGDKVHYSPLRKYSLTKQYENGIVKEIVDDEYVRVVYHCDNDWKNFKNYTSALTATRDLYSGWL